MPSLTPGPRDQLITKLLAEAIAGLDPELVESALVDTAEAPERLSRHAMGEIVRALRDEAAERSAQDQAELVNTLLTRLDASDQVALPPRILQGVRDRSPAGNVVPLPAPPSIPFSKSDLLVNAEGQPNFGSELRTELETAESVDLICAFVIWSGVRRLQDELGGVIERGGRVRVITTTYMGATEKKAVDELAKLGAEVRVALDARTTKLHAKAWLLERPSDLTTAFVGSSNLSHTALFDGLEWNVRLSTVDAAHVISRVRMTFESHWASPHFEKYDPDENGAELVEALRLGGRRSVADTTTVAFANLDVNPFRHQERMLEALEVERERHDRHQNLVVAATGTGKTVVAAFDYKRLVQRHGKDLSLLFVAHREQILDQSIATYRAVLRDSSFGEKLGGGHKPSGKHVFAMIQSLGDLTNIKPDAFDILVVDEFHHAKAATYSKLLDHLEPKELLGLTATPERLDGQDVTDWFGGRIAVELRLWEAIDQGFLVPFQYFGVADGTDLTDLKWKRGSYDLGELSNLYTNDNARVRALLQAIDDIAYDAGTMRALGFCVSVEHAEFMAKKFNEFDLPSIALSGDVPQPERAAALRKLQAGELRCIFSVEVLGEGVDVPNVDTLLLLRPTSSPTVFAQQLGRGLRESDGKSHLTVIDMIGQHRREFRFEDRLRSILDVRRGPIRAQVEEGFPFLPAGCTIDLDRQSEEHVLDNLRAAARRSRWTSLVDDLAGEREDLTLDQFLTRYDHRPEDVYKNGNSWTKLRRAAGKSSAAVSDPGLEATALKNLRRLVHVDDPERVSLYRETLAASDPPKISAVDERRRRLLTMLAWGLASGSSPHEELDEYFAALWNERALREELVELLGVLDERSETLTAPTSLPIEVPLSVHARYSREEVIAALGYGSGVKTKTTQGGILHVPDVGADVFFIDLKKSERQYSPTTMYHDYAVSPSLFHWESQSRQHTGQSTVQRYINHRDLDTKILLFVRERKQGELGTMPFTFLGEAGYVSHKGERPVAFTWHLQRLMPEALFEVARSVAVA